MARPCDHDNRSFFPPPDDANMSEREVERSSTTDGLPVATGLEPALEAEHIPARPSLVDARVVFLCGLSIALALAAGVVAVALTRLIALVTNVSFYGRLSTVMSAPSTARLGLWVV